MNSIGRTLSLLLAALLALAACGSSNTGGTGTPASATSAPAEPTTAATEATSAPTSVATEATAGDLQVDKSKLSATLRLYNWADYIDPAVLEQFKSEYGVDVTVDVYDNNEDMIAKVGTGNSGYDVVFPTDYAVQIMIQGNLLAKLDKTLLPNAKYLKPANMSLYYDKENAYSLPYNQGLTGIAYLKSKFPTPPDSWGMFFDPAQAEQIKNNGGFTMLDDEREVPGAALRYIGKSLNDTDAADLKQVEDILKAQKPFVSAYDSSSVSRKLSSGEIIAGHIYSVNALQARLGLSGEFPGNPDVAFFVPKEGGTIWQDTMGIVADSPNSYTAHVFFNFLMRPDTAAKNAQYILGITPNAEAEVQLPDAIKNAYKEGFAPDDEMLKRLEWIERNDQSSAFTDLWTAVKGE
jgi:spermidine/putrescine transport system substrate-binding protein